MATENKMPTPHWEAFLKRLADRLTEPTTDLPTTRCLSLSSLTTIVQDIRQSGFPATFPSTPKVLKHLINMGWAYQVNLEYPSEQSSNPAKSKKIYLLDIGADHNTSVDPLEVLQASKPKGVLCYFSALSFHSLTTQFATHYHIATISKPTQQSKANSIATATDKTEDHTVSPPKVLSLGEELFRYQGVPCYLTKRVTSTLAGIETRIIGPRTNINITTLEQTLLDTFHKPRYCGGPTIIFEAWEEGISRLDEELLIGCLQKIATPLLLRRIGAMFELFNFNPGKELGTLFESTLEILSSDYPASTAPLLPGYYFPVLNNKWKVTTI